MFVLQSRYYIRLYSDCMRYSWIMQLEYSTKTEHDSYWIFDWFLFKQKRNIAITEQSFRTIEHHSKL